MWTCHYHLQLWVYIEQWRLRTQYRSRVKMLQEYMDCWYHYQEDSEQFPSWLGKQLDTGRCNRPVCLNCPCTHSQTLESDYNYLSLSGVTNHWTGLLDWTSGLDYWTQNLTTKSHFPAVTTTKIYCQSSSKYLWQLEQFFLGASGYVATPRQVR